MKLSRLWVASPGSCLLPLFEPSGFPRSGLAPCLLAGGALWVPRFPRMTWVAGRSPFGRGKCCLEDAKYRRDITPWPSVGGVGPGSCGWPFWRFLLLGTWRIAGLLGLPLGPSLGSLWDPCGLWGWALAGRFAVGPLWAPRLSLCASAPRVCVGSLGVWPHAGSCACHASCVGGELFDCNPWFRVLSYFDYFFLCLYSVIELSDKFQLFQFRLLVL